MQLFSKVEVKNKHFASEGGCWTGPPAVSGSCSKNNLIDLPLIFTDIPWHISMIEDEYICQGCLPWEGEMVHGRQKWCADNHQTFGKEKQHKCSAYKSQSFSLAHAGCVIAAQPCGAPLSNSPLLQRERNIRIPKKITFVLNQSISPAGSVCCL